MQIDATNFKASLGENALDVMAIIIGRSANMIDRVAEAQEAFGGLDALRRDVLQTSAAARDGCPPNEAEPPTKPLPKVHPCALTRYLPSDKVRCILPLSDSS